MPATATADPRYKEFVQVLKEVWDANCSEIDFAFDGADGSQLKRLLTKHKSMTVDTFRRCVLNHLNSEGTPLCQRPCRYLLDLPRFMEAPLDRFGKLKAAKRL